VVTAFWATSWALANDERASLWRLGD